MHRIDENIQRGKKCNLVGQLYCNAGVFICCLFVFFIAVVVFEQVLANEHDA